MELSSLVGEIKTVGEARIKKLAAYNIYTVKDLIEFLPRDYEDRSEIKNIADLELNKENTFKGRIVSSPENIRIKNLLITRVSVKDETATVRCVWYNQSYMKNNFHIGDEVLFNGKYVEKYSKKEVQSPDFEKIVENSKSFGRIIPIYTTKIPQKTFRKIIYDTLCEVSDKVVEFLPDYIIEKYKLCSRGFAISNIHFPKDNESFFEARKRLVFEELFILQFALFYIKTGVNKKEGKLFDVENHTADITEKFEFALTDAQKKVVLELENDFTSGIAMNRLVQGDVGSGKTAVAMIASYIAIKNGFQAALIAPTEVLALQHFKSFTETFAELGIETALLTGSQRKKEKNAYLEKIANNEAKMIIGTHAVIQETVEIPNLGLAITDEQHRFGVRQRSFLAEKGVNPHILVMTATPIPRTLALILYGDVDISIIDELPPGRQVIKTSAISDKNHEKMYEFVKSELDSGRQAYIVCPMVLESEKLELLAVTEYTEDLKASHFKDYNIECLHGKMKPAEKNDIMQRFKNGEIDVIVSTTVIEVGINVVNASVMVIENAERFGLSQLHQLRGRVGRGSYKSYCILVCNSKSKVALERMKVMKDSNDGFLISEVDLKLRGPGDFFGTRQHGLVELKIANLYKDMDILKLAQEAASIMLKDENELEKNVPLFNEFKSKFNLDEFKIDI